MRERTTTNNGQEATTMERPQKVAISSVQERFLVALLTSPTQQAACLEAQISADSARRYLAQPLVQERYRELQKSYFDESLSLLAKFTRSSITTLASIMSDKLAPPGVRVRAAQILLEQSIQVHKVNELEQRIAELEGQE
jgi:hypothetical protein